MFLIFLLITTLISAVIGENKIYRLNSSTVADAPIMSIGAMVRSIFTEDVIFPWIGNILLYLMIGTIFLMISQYTFDYLHGVFDSSYIENLISSFSTGIWIAAISVFTVILFERGFKSQLSGEE